MANSNNAETNDVFSELDVDRLEVNVIESLCFSCGKNVSILFDLFGFVHFKYISTYIYFPCACQIIHIL